MSYKILGNYIKKVDNKNKDLKVLNLQGLSMTKEFRKSTSNIVGTDLSKYKIVKQDQFCCDFMSVIRVHKLPVVLNNLGEDVIISPAYVVFEITDKNVLLPEYLMMWFRRPEFDRYADFRCDSSIRGGFQWEELCEIKLPIPSIEEQWEIVTKYRSIENKIKINEQICDKIEITAQALYKNWFVDFEFHDENGKPYKSSGGKMVWNKELEKEVPENWKVNSFTKLCKIGGGGTPKTEIEEYWKNGNISFYSPVDKSRLLYTIKTEKHITDLGLKKCNSKLYPINTTFITARGATTGGLSIAGRPMAMNQTCYAIVSLIEKPLFTYFLTKSIIEQIKLQAVGATFEAVVTKNFDESFIVSPKLDLINKFENLVSKHFEYILNLINQNQKFGQLQNLILSQLVLWEETEV